MLSVLLAPLLVFFHPQSTHVNASVKLVRALCCSCDVVFHSPPGAVSHSPASPASHPPVFHPPLDAVSHFPLGCGVFLCPSDRSRGAWFSGPFAYSDVLSEPCALPLLVVPLPQAVGQVVVLLVEPLDPHPLLHVVDVACVGFGDLPYLNAWDHHGVRVGAARPFAHHVPPLSPPCARDG
ncbi:hypothetical protein NW754_011076 [Fusarium falciforme]|nr:hypothetical protein NW754_011076 [Fusarium falciforme]